jgi:hypothetical protein
MGLLWLSIGSIPLVLIVSGELPYLVTGIATEGTISNKSERTRRGAKGRWVTSHIVAYDFRDAQGGGQQGEGAIDRKTWDAVQVGDPVSVEYVPSDPRRNRPSGKGTPVSTFVIELAFALAGGIMTWTGAAWLITGFRTLSRRVRLIETGNAAAGLIDRLEPVLGKSGTPLSVNCEYHYRIPDRTGSPVQSHQGSVSLYPRQARSLRVGQLLLVLFDPERPEEHAVDVHHARLEDPCALWREQ